MSRYWSLPFLGTAPFGSISVRAAQTRAPPGRSTARSSRPPDHGPRPDLPSQLRGRQRLCPALLGSGRLLGHDPPGHERGPGSKSSELLKINFKFDICVLCFIISICETSCLVYMIFTMTSLSIESILSTPSPQLGSGSTAPTVPTISSAESGVC
jgi:hypothetical protein